MHVYRKVRQLDCYALENKSYVCIINDRVGVPKIRKVTVDGKTYKPPKEAIISFPKSSECTLKRKVLTCKTAGDLRKWL